MAIMLTKRRLKVENFLVDITVKSQGNTGDCKVAASAHPG